MSPLLIGNILCFTAAVIMALMGLIKDRKRFLAAQGVMNVIYIAGDLVLGGIAGAIANFVSLVRNAVCLKFKMTKPLKTLFIAFQVVFTVLTDRSGLLAWLPVLGNCVFTRFMDSEDPVLLRSVIIGSQIMWAIYDFAIMNFASFPFDIAATITNTVSLISFLRARRKEIKQNAHNEK